MAIKRSIDPYKLFPKRSFFLFGPRSIGKSWLLKKFKPENTLVVNLLSSDTYLRLADQPSLLEEMSDGFKLTVIDEIQKLPILLDEVHRLIEEKSQVFILTGSSARKLKRDHANMLGGRAPQFHLMALTSNEIPSLKLSHYLLYGGIPRVHLSDDPELDLEAFVQTYLEQEVQLESNIRNLPPFSRFLKAAAVSNGQLINFAQVASDCGVSSNTVREYYQILIDTLLGFKLEPWLDSKKRKAISTAKFYFFDTGVRNFICNLKSVEPHTEEWGMLFEHFIIAEVRAYNMYRQKRRKLFFWRSTSKHEVDLVIDSEIGIEIKSTKKIGSQHLKGIEAIKEEGLLTKYYVVSNDPIERTVDGIKMYPWRSFLLNLWNGKIFQ